LFFVAFALNRRDICIELKIPVPVGAARQTGSSYRNTKRFALLKSQKSLKLKYPNPFHWGAFVLVGD